MVQGVRLDPSLEQYGHGLDLPWNIGIYSKTLGIQVISGDLAINKNMA